MKNLKLNLHRLTITAMFLLAISSCTNEEIDVADVQDQSVENLELKVAKLNVNASAVHSSGSTSSKTKFYFADVTGDGKADKIYWKYDKYGGDIRVFSGTSTGNFSSAGVHSSGSTSNKTKFYFADVTGDGKADKIYWKYDKYGGDIRVFAATGSGNFSTTAVHSSGSVSTNTIYYFADISGDGKADKIYWNNIKYNGDLRVFNSNSSSGSFSTTAGNYSGSTDYRTEFYFAYINADSYVDKISWNWSDPLVNNVHVSYGSISGFSGGFSSSGSSSDKTKFYFADVNGGPDDKIYWKYDKYGGDMRYFTTTTINYTFFTTAVQGPGSSSNVTEHYFADINGDGEDDRIYWKRDKYSGDIRVFLN
jgi:VCBS repeat protein